MFFHILCSPPCTHTHSDSLTAPSVSLTLVKRRVSIHSDSCVTSDWHTIYQKICNFCFLCVFFLYLLFVLSVCAECGRVLFIFAIESTHFDWESGCSPPSPLSSFLSLSLSPTLFLLSRCEYMFLRIFFIQCQYICRRIHLYVSACLCVCACVFFFFHGYPYLAPHSDRSQRLTSMPAPFSFILCAAAVCVCAQLFVCKG